MRVVLGVDPGKKGHMAFLGLPDGPIVISLPYDGSDLDVCALRSILIAHRPDIAVVEQAGLMPRQRGSRTILVNYGRVLAALNLLGIGVEEVLPQKWQRVMLGSTNKGDKGVCVAKARQLFPTVEPMTPDVADALLIAEYGRRLFA